LFHLDLLIQTLLITMVSHSLYNWTFDIDLPNLIVTPRRRHCITVSVLDKYMLVLSTAGPTTQ
jgi:hypothetical protein